MKLIILCLCSFTLGFATIQTVVDSVAQGIEVGAIKPNKIDDPEHSIPFIPQDILDSVYAYLLGTKDLDGSISQDNYQDYLNAAKYFDLTAEQHKSTFPIRMACFLKSNGTLKSLEAFSYRLDSKFFNEYDEKGMLFPNKKFELYHAGQFELTFVPEWMEIQSRISDKVITTVKSFSEQLHFDNPSLLLFTGTYGAGKSYQVKHHPLMENIHIEPDVVFNGVLGTDDVKRVYMAIVSGATNNQVHHEGVALRLQIMKALFLHFPHLSILQEAVLSNEKNINDQFALTVQNGLKMHIVDVDVDLETACLRILTRDPSKGDAIPDFRRIVAAQKMIRLSRAVLHNKVLSNRDVESYELILSDHFSTSIVAFKDKDELKVTGNLKIALTPDEPEVIERVANRVVTKHDCHDFGDRLIPFVGMTLENALMKLSME